MKGLMNYQIFKWNIIKLFKDKLINKRKGNVAYFIIKIANTLAAQHSKFCIFQSVRKANKNIWVYSSLFHGIIE